MKKARLLSGDNPQIAKADGDAPVEAYIAAIPKGWKRDVSRELDELIVRTIPTVRKAVKWNSPFYGIEGRGWFMAFHMFNRAVKVTFFKGTSLDPPPPGGKAKEARWIDVHEDDLDPKQLVKWIKQAAKIPGWMAVLLVFTTACASQKATVKRQLEARYAENEAGFMAKDPDRVMRLRHPDFHTISPDRTVMNREQMDERTRTFISRIESFESLSEKITSLTLSGDTAHAMIDQATTRKQRFPDGTLHEVKTSVTQRESWIRTPQGWLMWRVDEVQPGLTLVDGKPPQN